MVKKGLVIIKDDEIIASGINMVIDFEYDKLIEVEKHVAKQVDKFNYINGNLKLRDNETLLTESELEKEYEREQEL